MFPMALAQVVLTAAESRRLIAHAISQMKVVQTVLDQSRIVLCTSSITPDILEALGFGRIPEQERGLYVCGMIRSEGLCTTDFDIVKSATIIDKGAIVDDDKLRAKILKSMGPGDIYIKSPNILDHKGRVGVLAGAPSCGTVGRMVYGLDDSRHTIIAPTLLLKSAPVDLATLQETVTCKNYSRDASEFVRYSCGMPVNLVVLPKRTEVVTEIVAIRQLFNLESKPLAVSGVGSGVDAVVLSVEGSEDRLRQFWKYVCSIKGKPSLITHPTKCGNCPDSSNHNRCGAYIKRTLAVVD